VNAANSNAPSQKSSWQLVGVGCVLVFGVLTSLLLGHLSAAVGVLLAVLTSLFALGLKGWAVKKGLDAALLVMGASFGVRLFTIGGALLVAHRFDATVPLVIGFFGAFAPLLVIEMAYVLRVQKSLAPCAEATSGSAT
jgi:hypothetical protein